MSMKSNFEFLNKNELTQQYFVRSNQAEQSYAIGIYPSVLIMVRTIAENIAKDVADQNFMDVEHSTFNDILNRLKTGAYIDKFAVDLFYAIKGPGNVAAHTLDGASKEEALNSLKNLYSLFVWFVGSYYDEKIDITAFTEPKKEDNLYQTTSYSSNAEKNLIYIQTADNSKGQFPAYIGSQKVGKTGVGDLAEDNSDNSLYLRDWATKRINQYMNTSGVPFKLEWAELAYRKSDGWWFSDHDVHRVLERSGIKHSDNLTGDEWFKTDLETTKRAIKAVKENKDSISITDKDKADNQIVLRPEQQAAVDKTKAGFKTSKKMLWNAKMRFGKTLTALKLIKEEKYQKVLIMTHRPVVNDGWFDDFNKIGMPDAGYIYGSKTKGYKSVKSLEKEDKSYIYFASIQDLAGSEIAGGKVSDKNRDLFGIDWDLVIVDEAHEGTQTELTQNVLDLVLKKNTKELDLSGTPFNILFDFDEDHVYTWDYTMEQEAKQNWYEEHPGVKNPYESLPKVSMFTFEMNKNFSDPRFNDINLGKPTFNFKEFFRTDKDGKFVYESDVNRFLDNISNPGKNNYPFSTRQFRRNLRHTLWIMPGIKEANALEDLLNQHPVFGKEYRILNVVRGDKSDELLGTDNDAEAENKQIAKADKEGLNTITLTVRKLTTGATIPEWTGVLFLSNISSAMQYLQAAFRAQTPYSSPEFGKKENCYIFDFAPDRALNIMAESTSLATGVGKIQTKEQRERMAKLMNFLPILGEANQGMKPFKVDTLLSHIKRAYAERAVRTGFDDDSIYSDQLLLIKEDDLEQFNNLKGIIGTTKKEKAPSKFDVNHQGLDEGEYDTAEKARKKKKRERTQAEQDAIDKVNELKKQRRTMISILRGISIRIPLMIYGMDIKFDEEVSINKFVNNIDDVSWKEFMPKGITKELFKQFIKYYDADVFIEAGKIIRQRVKDLDKVDPLDRVDKLAEIFATFRNPDKETVLTPWRVVNMHLGKTIGGLSFYDADFKSSYEDGKAVRRWIDTEYTNKVLNRDAHILEINAKTGLYPLYAATSIYWCEFQKMNEETAGKFNFEDEILLWQKILRQNIFVVAKTPMAKEITIRTLTGYHSDWISDVSAVYVENIVEDSKASVSKEADKIEGMFGNMKFDVVIGNPPYQEPTNKKTVSGQQPVQNIFQYFQELADNMGVKYSSLIYPGKRWIHQSGKGLRKFGYDLINDPHLARLILFEDSNQVFSDVSIPDGISIVFKDYQKDTTSFDYDYISKDGSVFREISVKAPGKKLLIVDPRDMKIANQIDSFVFKNNLDYINNSSVLNRSLFKIESNFVENNPSLVRPLSKDSKIDHSTEIKLFTNDKSGKSGRAKWFITKRSVISSHQELIDEYQVVVSSANAGGQKRDNQIQIIDNNSAFGRSRVALKSFKTEKEASNFIKYANSYFIKFAFLLTDESLTSLGKEVPDLLDYSDDNKFVDYSNSIDNQLFKLFNFNANQINYVINRVNSVRR